MHAKPFKRLKRVLRRKRTIVGTLPRDVPHLLTSTQSLRVDLPKSKIAGSTNYAL